MMEEAAPSIICQVADANGCSSFKYHCTVTVNQQQDSFQISCHALESLPVSLERYCPGANRAFDSQTRAKNRLEETKHYSDGEYRRSRK